MHQVGALRTKRYQEIPEKKVNLIGIREIIKNKSGNSKQGLYYYHKNLKENH